MEQQVLSLTNILHIKAKNDIDSRYKKSQLIRDIEDSIKTEDDIRYWLRVMDESTTKSDIEKRECELSIMGICY